MIDPIAAWHAEHAYFNRLLGLLQDDAWLRYAHHANRCARLLAQDLRHQALVRPVRGSLEQQET